MFLLILREILFRAKQKDKFTFHYVSTYTAAAGSDAVTLSNLHSTMFLLIHWRIWLIIVFLVHLHSTMFLLIPMGIWKRLRLYLDLHSTMFLLIQFPIQSEAPLSLIYIPLCFYLYQNSTGSTTTISDLHSTMFLLILSLLAYGRIIYA